MSETDRVLAEVCREREYQNEYWGGAEHDDDHRWQDWFDFIRERLDQGDEYAYGNPPPEYRRRLVVIASLAVAAVEAYDRSKPAAGAPGPAGEATKPKVDPATCPHTNVAEEERSSGETVDYVCRDCGKYLGGSELPQ